MSKLNLPQATSAALKNAIPLAGEIIYNKDTKRIVIGTGFTKGGVDIELKPEQSIYVYGVDVKDGDGPIANRANKVVLQQPDAYNGEHSVYIPVDKFNRMPCHKLRRCVMADNATRTVAYYLNDQDSNLKENGEPANLTGVDGDVFVEFPVSYYRIDHYTDTEDISHTVKLISTEPFKGSKAFPFFYVSKDGLTLRKQYIGAFPASRTADGKLRSVSDVKPAGAARPVEDIAAAEANHAQVANFLYRAWLGWLIEIEFASSDSQADVSDGFVWLNVAEDSANWRDTGRTAVFGNKSGEIMADTAKDSDLDGKWVDGKPHIVQMSYRGLEDVWGSAFESINTAKYFEDLDSRVQGGLWTTTATDNYKALADNKEPDNKVDILDKKYETCRVGEGDIGQLWTNRNLDTGDLGRYYNDDVVNADKYGSLLAPDQVKILDSALRGVGYNPVVDGRIFFDSFVAPMKSIGTGDFTFEIEFEVFGETQNNAFIFQTAATAGTFFIGVWVNNGFFSISANPISERGYVQTNYKAGKHTLKLERVGNTANYIFDGLLIKTVTGTPMDTALLSGRPDSSADCHIIKASLRNSTKVIWALDGVPRSKPAYTLPSSEHIDILINLAGGSNKAGKALKSTEGWGETNPGTDTFGFNMPAAGYLKPDGVHYIALNESAMMWSTAGTRLALLNNSDGVNFLQQEESYSYSVRCLKTRSSIVISGRRYPTVLIGDQWWTAENLRDMGGTHVPKQSDKYGDYYDFDQFTAVDNQLKASNSSYRIPRQDEYERYMADGTPLKPFRSRTSWSALIGTNQSGFDILHSGFVETDGKWNAYMFQFATATPHPSNPDYYRVLTANNGSNLNTYYTAYLKQRKVSLRLVKRFYDVEIFGQVHRFVKIGAQYWDTKNLDYAGSDGTLGVYYNNDPEIGKKYGRHYSFDELLAIKQELAAAGINIGIPSTNDALSLVTYNGGTTAVSGEFLKSTSDWLDNGNGKDTYELNILPSGYKHENDSWTALGSLSYIWCDMADNKQYLFAAGSSTSSTVYTFDVTTNNREGVCMPIRLIYKPIEG